MMKKTFVTGIFFLFLIQIHGLDLSNTESKLADIFSSQIDPNEGSTVFRSQNIPTGGRTEALGTAYTALCDDSGFFDYNPAGSVILEESEISLSHNAWIADSALESLALTRRNGNFGYGAQLKCFYVPFTEYNLYGERVAGSYYSETTATFNAAYTFLAGYTFRGISIGANAKAAWRSVPDYTDNRDDSIISGSGLEQSALGLMGDLGAIVSFNAIKFYQDRKPNLRLALALNNFGTTITGFGSSIKKDDDSPSRLSMGFSYRPFAPLLITAEFRKPVLLSDFSSSSKASFATGIEARITQIFAFQCGFLLQGANPRFSIGSEFDIKGIKMDVAYTLDLTTSANPVNHISLSAKMTFGDRGRKAAMDEVDRLYIEGLKFYSQGYYNEAIIKWEEAIKTAASPPLKIKFEPAIQARDAAINFNRQKSSLENMYNISFDEE